MPTGRQRSRLRLAVAHHAGDDQVGVVEGRAIGVRQGVAQLAALVDRAGRLGRDVAGNAAGPGELAEQPVHAVPAALDGRKAFGVGALQIGVGHQTRSAVPRPDNVDHAEVVLDDQPVQVDVQEIEARRRAPVPQQPRLDVRHRQRDFEQRVLPQVDLTDGQIVRRPPVGIHARHQVGRQRGGVDQGLPHRRPAGGSGAIWFTNDLVCGRRFGRGSRRSERAGTRPAKTGSDEPKMERRGSPPSDTELSP